MSELSASAGAEAAAEAEIEAQGGASFDLDAEAIAKAAAGGAAAGGCAALGLAAAAPLCAYVGSEVAGWAIKEIGGPLVEFLGGLFGADEIEESLIEFGSDFESLWAVFEPHSAASELLFRAPLLRLLCLAHELQIPNYSTDDAVADLRAAGLHMVERPDLELGDHYVISRTGDDCRYGSHGLLVRPYWIPDWQAWIRELFPRGFDADDLLWFRREIFAPWYATATERAFPEVAARLSARAVALETDRRMLQAISELPAAEQSELRDLALLAALSPAEQQRLRDYFALAQLTEGQRQQLRALAGEPMPDRSKWLEATAIGAQSAEPSGAKAAVGLSAAGALGAALWYLPRFLLIGV